MSKEHITDIHARLIASVPVYIYQLSYTDFSRRDKVKAIKNIRNFTGGTLKGSIALFDKIESSGAPCGFSYFEATLTDEEYQALRNILEKFGLCLACCGRELEGIEEEDLSYLQKLLKPMPYCPIRQDSVYDQLVDLVAVANRCGMYDAADFLRKHTEITEDKLSEIEARAYRRAGGEPLDSDEGVQ